MRVRRGRSKLILLVVCGLIAVLVGTSAGLLIGRRSRAGKHGAAKKPEPVETKSVYSLGEMVVNLADTGSLRYAKLTVALGVEQKLPEDGLKDQEPVLRDAVICVVTRKRFEDLHRTDGLPKLKNEIYAVVQKRLRGVTLTDVYLDSFAMQ